MKKYFEVYKTIKNKIISGEYPCDYKLPSKRTLADISGCSVITIEKAYGMLLDEGYIISRERSGYYVNKIDGLYENRDTSTLATLKYVEDDISDLRSDFEYSLWFKTTRKVISEYGEKLFFKSPNKGCAVLRNAIADYLLRYRGMRAEPERIIIGSGAEQLYQNVVQILGRDRIYGIENPCYEQIEAVYNAEGAKIVKLKMGKEGIEDKKICDADVLHVTPFHSYPTGVTTSISKRYEYLNWATDGKYIIEDDFDSEFFMPGQPIESLYSLDSRSRVIYINTFSKSISPAMRMGYMILPEKLLNEYDRKLGNFSCTVPVMEQYILAEFIKSGNFERHLNRVRRKMKQN
ncbi:MAG: PLP-dependent aminotransferase family protein [Ruminococcaceae bacterium]|nr:PLP-dependent aminotransferase family protein [Oscillospiraceae bacterium]